MLFCYIANCKDPNQRLPSSKSSSETPPQLPPAKGKTIPNKAVSNSETQIQKLRKKTISNGKTWKNHLKIFGLPTAQSIPLNHPQTCQPDGHFLFGKTETQPRPTPKHGQTKTPKNKPANPPEEKQQNAQTTRRTAYFKPHRNSEDEAETLFAFANALRPPYECPRRWPARAIQSGRGCSLPGSSVWFRRGERRCGLW